MKRSFGSILALLLAAPLAAQAADGVVTGNVNLRAGPDIGYPSITVIPAGAPVDVQGCTAGWEWCDVVAYGNRGWVAGNFIQYAYQNQTVLLPAYGARIGIPIVSFVIGSYWDRYYRDRPFYSQRNYWYGRPPLHRPPPPPVHRPYPPPGGGHRPPPWRPPGHSPGPRPPGGDHGPGPRPPGGDHRPGRPSPRPPGSQGPRPGGPGPGQRPGRPPGGSGPGQRPGGPPGGPGPGQRPGGDRPPPPGNRGPQGPQQNR